MTRRVAGRLRAWSITPLEILEASPGFPACAVGHFIETPTFVGRVQEVAATGVARVYDFRRCEVRIVSALTEEALRWEPLPTRASQEPRRPAPDEAHDPFRGVAFEVYGEVEEHVAHHDLVYAGLAAWLGVGADGGVSAPAVLDRDDQLARDGRPAWEGALPFRRRWALDRLVPPDTPVRFEDEADCAGMSTFDLLATLDVRRQSWTALQVLRILRP